MQAPLHHRIASAPLPPGACSTAGSCHHAIDDRPPDACGTPDDTASGPGGFASVVVWPAAVRLHSITALSPTALDVARDSSRLPHSLSCQPMTFSRSAACLEPSEYFLECGLIAAWGSRSRSRRNSFHALPPVHVPPNAYLFGTWNSQRRAAVVVAAGVVRDADVPRLADDSAALRVAHAREEQQLHGGLQTTKV